jgi:type IV secretory pathway VirB2 component (pilin)
MKINKISFLLLFIISLLFVNIIPINIQAALLNSEGIEAIGPEVGAFAENAGYDLESVHIPLEQRIGNIIQIVLGFVGTLFLILIIISGFQWMMAGGNTDTITKAKQRMINATIGLVIVLAAYSITWFITEQALNITSVDQVE